MTAVDGNVLSASQFNRYVRNNLNETAPAKVTEKGRYIVSDGANNLGVRKCVSAFDSNPISFDTATTASWVDGGGPSVPCITGSAALVFMGAWASNEADDAVSGVGVEVSGSTSKPLTFDTDGQQSMIVDGIDPATGTNNAIRVTQPWLVTDLNPGTNVFTLKYRQHNAGKCWYVFREVVVFPL